MPRFMIERDFQFISEEEMDERRSEEDQLSRASVGGQRVCHTATGEIKAFCVYSAPSAERLFEHRRDGRR